MSEAPTELFFEKQRRIERENNRLLVQLERSVAALADERRLSGQLIMQLGERDVEISRLREALGMVVAACDEKSHCQTIREIRGLALKTLERGKG